LLGGCDDFYRAIGKEKVVPDEFAVVSRAPLAIPPDFALRPPRFGAQRPQEVAPTDQARQTVFRAGDQQAALPPAAETRSVGETALLHDAGAGSSPADIRKLVDSEAQDSGEMSDSFVDKLAFWRKDQKLGATDNVIDPTAEAERLRALKAGGQTASSGLDGTPTIERTNAAKSSSPGFFSWVGNLL
jgi:hypothetical protein